MGQSRAAPQQDGRILPVTHWASLVVFDRRDGAGKASRPGGWVAGAENVELELDGRHDGDGDLVGKIAERSPASRAMNTDVSASARVTRRG